MPDSWETDRQDVRRAGLPLVWLRSAFARQSAAWSSESLDTVSPVPPTVTHSDSGFRQRNAIGPDAVLWIATRSRWSPDSRHPLFAAVLTILVLLSSSVPAALAAEPSDSPAAQLADRQQQLAQKYERLEQILLRMSELTAASDPARAALLTKAVAQSKQRLIGVQFASLVDQLSKDELAKALEGQEKLDADLDELLKLLLSENRSTRLASEKARIRQYLQQLNQIINQQKSLQARTVGGAGQPKELSQEQGQLGEQAGGLAGEIRKNEEENAEPAGTKDADQTPPGEKSAAEDPEGPAGKLPDSKAEEDKPADSSKVEGEKAEPAGGGKSGDEPQPGTPPEKASAESQGAEGHPQFIPEPSPSQPPASDAHPARQRLEAARQRMQQAQEKLEQAERQGASQEQEDAIRELQQAKAELERILRQLREEEIEQVLVALEARLIKMLQMQRDVYQGTERLDKASADALTHEQEIEAGRLSSREAEIVLESDKALMLLREDGSAVAMPEALAQAREDMQQVVDRLGRANVGEVTLSIEEDIVVALEEMLAAVRQAMEDAEQRRQDSQQGEPRVPQDPALVDVLAELKMIRSLQLRVNTRTERYGKLISGRHAETPELVEALIRLAERQQRVYQITTDLEAGRNQ